MYSSSVEKSWALLKGEELLSRGTHVISDIIWLSDSLETAIFKAQFADWNISVEGIFLIFLVWVAPLAI